MAPFNTKDKRAPRSAGVMTTENAPSGLTGNGAPGFAYEDKSALFLLATTSFFGQDKFYAKAADEDKRFVELVRKVTEVDPVWVRCFLTWLRANGNMRTSAVVGSVESAKALVDLGKRTGSPWVRVSDLEPKGPARMVAQAGIQRLDEVGEAVAYYQATYKSKALPKPVKRGLADALVRLTNEYSSAKYNSANRAWSLGQLIQFLHPSPKDAKQAALFKYLVAKDYGDAEIPTLLDQTTLRASLLRMSMSSRREMMTMHGASIVLRDAGFTWEQLAGWLQGPMDKDAWEAIIPSMGYFALLRNLRNFDEAKISNKAAAQVMAKLADENEVKRAKLFPFRFLAAYKNAPNARWAGPLGLALDASLANIPVLPGRTLVLVDTSGSMDSQFSEHSEMKRWDAAALFGIALGKAAEGHVGSSVDVVSYSDGGSYYGTRYAAEKPFKLTKGADLLSEMKNWISGGYNIGGGTDTMGAMNRNYRGHDRVILLTDEQTSPGTVRTVPADKHVFVFNLAGYRFGQQATGKFRHSFGGLTDACFPMIAQIEGAAAGVWPWETQA